jgi:alkylation response protein AidB-like acyl-CoA dehydrogenase
MLPEAGDVDPLAVCLLREGLAQFCTEAETALAMQGLGGSPILRFGGREVRERWMPPIVRGDAVAAFAMTEPEHGSDATSLELRAERVDGGFRLTGEKAWISNAPGADVYTLFARTTPDAGSKGITTFVVPGDAEGLSGEPVDLLSDHPIGRLRLESVFVSDGKVLGAVDGGWSVATTTFATFRPSVGAFAVGMAQAALDAAVAHSRTREQFGRAIGEFQAVSHPIAEMATRLEAARTLVYRAAWSGSPMLASMAKLFATEQAQWIVDVAVQIHGAAALERGHPLEHLYREVRAPRIYEGTSEIQREIIARTLLR